MPPDITAGLMALVGPPPAGPPGAASPSLSADPPASGAPNVILFASLLTQSSPPTLQLAAPKTDAPPTIKLGFAAKPQTLNQLKIMDTLPALSFPAPGTAAASASEFSSSPTGRKLTANHKTAADDTAADTSPNAVDLTAAVLAAVPVQAVLAPVVAAPVSSRVSGEIAGASAPSITPTPLSAPAAASRLNAVSGLNAVALPGSLILPDNPVLPRLEAPTASVLGSSASSSPALASLRPALSSLLAQSPQAAAPQAELPAAPLTGQVKSTVNAFPVLTRAVPQLSPVASVQASSPAEAAPLFLLSPIHGQAVPIPRAAPASSAPSASVLGALAPSVAAVSSTGVPAPISFGSAKQPGKFSQTALKSPPANADTYTRITAGIDAKVMPAEAPASNAKIVLPANLPEADTGSQGSVLDKISDAKAEAKATTAAPNGTLEAGAPFAQAAAPTLTSRPLPVADQIKIVHQVADGVGAMPLPAKPGGVQQMSLQLHPKDWGSLHVSVSVTPEQEAGSAKTVTAHIVAETPQVKAALQSQTGALHQALRASGLNLTHLTVSVKPAEETVKPAAQSASAGFSGGQGQANTGSNQAQQGHTAPGSQPPGTQFGTSAGSSHSGRQGQPPLFTSPAAQAGAEETLPVPPPTSVRLSGRIDTHA